ncbi:MAG: hypothetical protein ABIH41_05090, partial [Nanoarchaeota archaeon]
LGEIVHADFLMEGCTFTEFMVGVGGFEVDEDEQHELHLSDGDLTLVNNTFNTPLSVLWCSSPSDRVTLIGNRGGPAAILGWGFRRYLGNAFDILNYDPTGFEHHYCEAGAKRFWHIPLRVQGHVMK